MEYDINDQVTKDNKLGIDMNDLIVQIHVVSIMIEIYLYPL